MYLYNVDASRGRAVRKAFVTMASKVLNYNPSDLDTWLHSGWARSLLDVGLSGANQDRGITVTFSRMLERKREGYFRMSKSIIPLPGGDFPYLSIFVGCCADCADCSYCC